MRSFACRNCGQQIFFENSRCLNCDAPLGFEWEPRELWTRSMRLLVDEVLPRL